MAASRDHLQDTTGAALVLSGEHDDFVATLDPALVVRSSHCRDLA
jgi:hypothetical protein